jgi:chromosome segregation ATPase
MGFNTAGYLKSAIEPEDKWFDTEESLYVKVFDSDNPAATGLLTKRQATRELHAKLKKEDPAPPDVWADENEIGGGEKAGDVISTLQEITADTRKEEEETHMDEEANQHAFEEEMDTLKADEKTCLDTIVSLEETVALKEADIEAKHVDKEQTHKEMKSMERYLEKIKPGCDFITENIDTRKENRAGELEALQKAIENLQSTPAFKAAEAEDEKNALGECAVKCSNRDSLECVACIGGTTVSGYCAGHSHPDC